jgi:AraC family transcriptional regulator of arabinose operon
MDASAEDMDDIRAMMIPRSARLRLGYLYGGSVRYQPGEALGPRDLADYEMVLLTEGSAIYQSGEAAHEITAGDLVLARPGFRERYTWDGRQFTRHSYFHFSIESIPHPWPAPDLWPVIHRQPDRAVESLFHSILRRSHRPGGQPASQPPPLDTRMVELLMELLLEPRAGASIPEDGERPQPVARALKWMRHTLEENPHATVSLDELARQAGVSSKHLCRVFRHSIGHSPMVTLRLLRLQLAVALLVRSSLAVKEIASQCGFSDALYFSRCFSSAFGRSPSRVRLELQHGIPPPGNPLPVDLTPRIHW